MTDLLSNVGRFAYGLAGLGLYLGFRGRPPARRAFLPGLWMATRIGGFLLLYVFLGLGAPTDTHATYLPQAHAAIAGQVPYRDFNSSFGPLFPFLLAGLTLVRDSPFIFIVAAMLAEGALLLLWSRLGPRLVPPDSSRRALFAYVCCVLPFNTVIMGQDELWIALLLTVTLLLVDRGRWIAAGALTGFALPATKFTSLLMWPFLARGSRNPWRFLALAAAVAAPFYAWIALAGGDILAPIRFEGSLVTNGNLPFLGSLIAPSLFLGRTAGIAGAAVLSCLLGVWFLRSRRLDPADTKATLVAITVAELAFLLLFRKSYHSYLAVVYPALCLLMAARLPRWLPALLILGTLSVTQQSYFFRIMDGGTATSWRLAGSSAGQWLFVLTDLLCVLGYLALGVALVRAAFRSSADGAAPA